MCGQNSVTGARVHLKRYRSRRHNLSWRRPAQGYSRKSRRIPGYSYPWSFRQWERTIKSRFQSGFRTLAWGVFEFVVNGELDRVRLEDTIDPQKGANRRGGEPLENSVITVRFVAVTEDVLLTNADIVVVSTSSLVMYESVGQQTEQVEETYILVEVKRDDRYDTVYHVTLDGEPTRQFPQSYLSNPLRLFRDYRFPDGVYRLRLRDGDAAPVEILEVEIKQGRPVPPRAPQSDTMQQPEPVGRQANPARGEEMPEVPEQPPQPMSKVDDERAAEESAEAGGLPVVPGHAQPIDARRNESHPITAGGELAILTGSLAAVQTVASRSERRRTPTWDRWRRKTRRRSWRSLKQKAASGSELPSQSFEAN